MRIVGVIPARWGSTRFPGKSLHPIFGKPLVAWVIAAAKRAQLLQEIIVATDDERIADAVADTGAQVVMTRSDHPSGTDRVAEAARASADDIVVNIQGDEPLIDPAVIDALVQCLLDSRHWSMATAACPITTLRDLEARTVVKVVLDQHGGAMYFSRLPIPCMRDGAPDLTTGLYLRHIGIYAYRGEFLKKMVDEPPCRLERAESLEQLRALHLGGRIGVIVTDHAGVGVDTPEDVGYVEAALREENLVL